MPGSQNRYAGDLTKRVGAATGASPGSTDTPSPPSTSVSGQVDLPGAKPIALDIIDPASVAAAAQATGDVTVLINNAGSSTGSDLLAGDLNDIRLEMDTHYFGTLSVVRGFAAPDRGQRRRGDPQHPVRLVLGQLPGDG